MPLVPGVGCVISSRSMRVENGGKLHPSRSEDRPRCWCRSGSTGRRTWNDSGGCGLPSRYVDGASEARISRYRLDWGGREVRGAAVCAAAFLPC
jgi:hypothetical protein